MAAVRVFRVEAAILTMSGASSATGSCLTSEIEQLFSDHSAMLYRTAYGMLGNRADAEDVLQTLFLRLLRRDLPQDLIRNPAGYLYRAIVNLSLNVIRSRRQFVPAAEALEVAIDDESSRAAEERHRQLMDAIAGLNPKDTEVLVLRYVHGRSDADIATLLDVSRGTIAMRLFRSRLRLRKLIGGQP
jgi:RNA polymerase sigma-70 factor (ECF subfamily)